VAVGLRIDDERRRELSIEIHSTEGIFSLRARHDFAGAWGLQDWTTTMLLLQRQIRGSSQWKIECPIKRN
jgi:hypothetical protein